jgi:hypothetical protein
MPSSPSRRRLLAAFGLGGVGLLAGYTDTISVPYLSPAWDRWRTRVDRPGVIGNRAGAADGRLFVTFGGRVVALDTDTGESV